MEERRSQRRSTDERWRTALTCIEPNKIIVRGYPLDEIMGRLTFGEAIYLLLMGEIPSPALGRLMEAILVSFIDHGATPPSTLAARNTATTGAALRACVAAGVLGFGKYHGGDIESCMQFLDTGLEIVRRGGSYRQAAEEIVQRSVDANEIPPGFGHRFHTRDPRAARLFQMALELEAEAEHIQMIRAVENVLHEKPGKEALPVNIDGAIAAVCGDIGIPPAIANALFIISRVPGIAAHADEERVRQQPMRQIDPKDHIYDGPVRAPAAGERRQRESLRSRTERRCDAALRWRPSACVRRLAHASDEPSRLRRWGDADHYALQVRSVISHPSRWRWRRPKSPAESRRQQVPGGRPARRRGRRFTGAQLPRWRAPVRFGTTTPGAGALTT